MPESAPATETLPSNAIAALLDGASKPNYPGAAVLAARNGKVIFRGAYGSANVELDVPIVPSMVFRLASLTKQFTAMAIMLLVEQGRLRFEDELRTLLPEYPATAHPITVEHLLTHTSGIKSYTGMKEWVETIRNDIAFDDLIAVFKEQPLEFVPGERWSYNNSAYVLLGAIIERVSGRSYEEFLKENIFEPLGMRQTMLDRSERIVGGRVSGYSPGSNGFQNAAYMSMTHPYAAGALLSTVDDMLLWDEALHTGQLVSPRMLERAHTPFVLNDGTSSGYGYGWAVFDYDGNHIVAHSGGINGFSTYALRIPAEHVYVVVLMNNTLGEPSASMLAMKIACVVRGKPHVEPRAIVLDDDTTAQYVGVYAGRYDEDYLIRRIDDQLVLVQPRGSHDVLHASALDSFFVAESFMRVHFIRDSDGAIRELEIRNLAVPQRAIRTERPLPPERVAIALDTTVLERYKGTYEIAPNMFATVGGDEEQLALQLPGKDAVPIFPESTEAFFLKVADVQIVFKHDERGDVVALEVRKGGKNHLATKKR